MIGHGLSRFSRALVFGMAMTTPALAQNAPAPAALPKVDLKLFERAEVDRSKGCSFALWQSDRDPEKDRYAYIFIENIGRNSVRENARIKVGNEVLTFKRIAVGGTQQYGDKTFPNALYKADKDDSYLVFSLKLEDAPGEIVEVESGKMTVIRPGLPPFATDVKGAIGCHIPNAAPAPATPAAPAPKRAEAPAPVPEKTGGRPAIFEKYSVPGKQIPRRMVAEAEKKLGCMGSVMRRGATGYSLSEESALWEIPCDTFAYQGHSVFAIVYTTDPSAQFEFLGFDGPKGKPRPQEENQLMMPTWDIRNRIVTSISLGRGQGDCGTLERHQFGQDRQFKLIEYRDKPNCDGKEIPPEKWPLVYKR
jgi:hypothetical protein